MFFIDNRYLWLLTLISNESVLTRLIVRVYRLSFIINMKHLVLAYTFRGVDKKSKKRLFVIRFQTYS